MLWVVVASMLVFCGTFMCAATIKITHMYGEVTLDQIFAHLMIPGEFVPWAVRFPFVKALVCVILCWAAATALLVVVRHFACRKRSCVSGKIGLWLWRLSYIAVPLFFVSSIWFVHYSFKVGEWLRYGCQYSTFMTENYVSVTPEQVSFDEKHSMVVIVCESLENTLLDENVFPERPCPGLAQLRENGMTFDSRLNVGGTHWTVAALRCILFGVPASCFFRNDPVAIGHSGRYSLFDILSSHGYDCSYLQGGTMEFAGKRRLFEHSPQVVVRSFDDYREDEEYLREPEKYEWGVHDEVLFKHAKEHVAEAIEKGRPFCTMVLTLNTHPVEGFLASGTPTPYGDRYLNAFHRLDANVCDFVSFVRERDPNVRIAILGDHAVMRCSLYRRIESSNCNLRGDNGMRLRQAYNCFLGPGVVPQHVKGRRYAAFDWMPTLLQFAGGRWNGSRMALGTSLFSGDGTLLERFGVDVYETETKKSIRQYSE
ncbi:MAG: LTA synthase family protein [Victivallaceae bacterium]|nr:LTA synthase family protein [Victivallaceae bacterium]